MKKHTKNENGFCFESDLPEPLKTSLSVMKDYLKKAAEGIEDSRWDAYWDELNSDINCAEVDGLIDHEQANALREKYLGMEVF